MVEEATEEPSLFEELNEADGKFVEALIANEKLKPNLKDPLIRLLGIRRRLAQNLNDLEIEPTLKMADKARDLESKIKKAGGEVVEEGLSDRLDNLNFQVLASDAKSVETELGFLALVSSQIARAEIDRRLVGGQEVITLLDMRKILGDSEIDGNRIMGIAKERVPLFDIQILENLDVKE